MALFDAMQQKYGQPSRQNPKLNQMSNGQPSQPQGWQEQGPPNAADRSASYARDPYKAMQDRSQRPVNDMLMDTDMGMSKQRPPTGSNSPVSSNGRIQAGPPPAWSRQAPLPQSQAPAQQAASPYSANSPAAVAQQKQTAQAAPVAPAAPAAPVDHSADIKQMMKENPGQFKTEADAKAWGESYYGWNNAPAAAPGAPAPGGAAPAPAPFNPATWTPGAPSVADPAAVVDPRQSLTFDPNQFAQYNANAGFSGYNGGQMVDQAVGTNFDQYQAYGQGFNPQQNALMGSILQNPETMSAQNVGALKEKQKETAMAFQRQQQQGIGQNAAARGFSGAGGQAIAQQQAAGAATQGNLLKGYRDVDLQKMAQDRKDQFDALDAATGLMDSQQTRGINDYDTGLKGQQAQATENSNTWNNNLKGTTANNLLDQTRYASSQEAIANNNAENLNSYKSAADADTKALQRMGIGVDATNSFNTANLGAGAQGLQKYGADMDFLSGFQNRSLQDKLGGMANTIDTERNSISRLGANNSYNLGLLGNQTDLLGLSLNNEQFGKTFGLNQQKFGLDKTNSFYDALFGASNQVK